MRESGFEPENHCWTRLQNFPVYVFDETGNFSESCAVGQPCAGPFSASAFAPAKGLLTRLGYSRVRKYII